MTCLQASTNNGLAGSGKPTGGGYATEAECLQACKEGACCEGTTCSIKPQCQCQGTGQTFKGVGTVCEPNPCLPCGCDTAVNRSTLTLSFSEAYLWGFNDIDPGICKKDSDVIAWLNSISVALSYKGTSFFGSTNANMAFYSGSVASASPVGSFAIGADVIIECGSSVTGRRLFFDIAMCPTASSCAVYYQMTNYKQLTAGLCAFTQFISQGEFVQRLPFGGGMDIGGHPGLPTDTRCVTGQATTMPVANRVFLFAMTFAINPLP